MIYFYFFLIIDYVIILFGRCEWFLLVGIFYIVGFYLEIGVVMVVIVLWKYKIRWWGFVGVKEYGFFYIFKEECDWGWKFLGIEVRFEL